MNINDTVLYSENGEEFVATVLEIREVTHHSGENGEPLLHLGFFKPVMRADATGQLVRKSVVGTHEQHDLVQFRFDVAHESHSFGEAANKAGLKGTYPGGRWRHVVPVEVAPDDVVVKPKKVKKESVQ